VTNVTARKGAEHALANQRRMGQTILTNTPDLPRLNREHRFIYANEGRRAWGAWEEASARTAWSWVMSRTPPARSRDRAGHRDEAAGARRVPFSGAGRRFYDYLLVPVTGAREGRDRCRRHA
jgi:hypothetical protein